MNRLFRYYLSFFFLMIALVACEVKRPEEVLPEDTLEALLYDYHLARAMGEDLTYNENYKKPVYLNAVFQKYHTTQAVFDSSLVWYTRNTEILSKIYEKVQARLKNEQDLILDLIAQRDKKPKMTLNADSVDVWPWHRLVRLTGKKLGSRYIFDLPTDTNYHDRDTMVWKARFHFQEPMLADSLRLVTMGMQLIYQKDTISEWTHIQESGWHQVAMQADTLGQLKQIKGFIYYPAGDEKAGTLLIDQLQMHRYHCQDTLSVAKRDSLNRLDAAKEEQKKKEVKPVATPAKPIEKSEVKEENVEQQRMDPDAIRRRRNQRKPVVFK